MRVPHPHIAVILSISLSLSYSTTSQTLQWPESVQPGRLLQAPAVDHQPHRCRRRRRRWKQPGGSRGVAVQSESFFPPAVFPTCPHQSLRTVLSDWLGLQAHAGCHHLRQPSAAQVERRKCYRCVLSLLHHICKFGTPNKLPLFHCFQMLSSGRVLNVVYMFLHAILLYPKYGSCVYM